MQGLFVAVRRGDLAKVERLVDRDPSLVLCTAKAPPKKDDGQSPLQVALKTGHFDVADLLVDRGADVRFIERRSVNEWRAPVVHDAIRAAVLSTRYCGPCDGCVHRGKLAHRAHASLMKLLGAGADVGARDSYGYDGLMRAAADALELDLDTAPRQVAEHVRRVFALLLDHGADPEAPAPLGESVARTYAGTPVAPLLRRATLRLLSA